MIRFDLNNACEGESGKCRAELEPSQNGDWIHYSEAERLMDNLKTIADGEFETLEDAMVFAHSCYRSAEGTNKP